MKILRNNCKTVIIATGGQGTTCPRLLITGGRSSFVDDYHGRLGIKNSFVRKIFGR